MVGKQGPEALARLSVTEFLTKASALGPIALQASLSSPVLFTSSLDPWGLPCFQKNPTFPPLAERSLKA